MINKMINLKLSKEQIETLIAALETYQEKVEDEDVVLSEESELENEQFLQRTKEILKEIDKLTQELLKSLK